MTPRMAPIEDKIRVSARISKELDARIRQHYASAAQAINEALELLVEIKDGTYTPSNANGANSDAKHDASKTDTRTHDANFGSNDYADKGTNGANNNAEGNSDLKSRLFDALAQVEFLKGQIAIKDNQISIKDQQLDKQAFSLQSVIQENSRLNIKLLPESPETKKAKKWYEFWK
jgi:hypothetical protein